LRGAGITLPLRDLLAVSSDTMKFWLSRSTKRPDFSNQSGFIVL